MCNRATDYRRLPLMLQSFYCYLVYVDGPAIHDTVYHDCHMPWHSAESDNTHFSSQARTTTSSHRSFSDLYIMLSIDSLNLTTI